MVWSGIPFYLLNLIEIGIALTEQIFAPSYSVVQFWPEARAGCLRRLRGLPNRMICLAWALTHSVKLVNDLKFNMWLASTSQHYLFKAQMLPFFIKRYYSSPNFAWCKFQNNRNFARNGAPELLMKLKQQNKYEKYDCVLFIIVKQSWEWYLLCLTVAQANSTICGISRANKMRNVLSVTIFF